MLWYYFAGGTGFLGFKMRVSVIVPLFNKVKYVERALNSIRAQGFSDFEVIVVDDGSTDGGAEIARRCCDPRFRVISQANRGPGAARNRGLTEARAPYIAFLDADDVWLPMFLGTNVKILEANPEAAAVCGGWIDYPQARPSADVWVRRGISKGVYRVSPEVTGRSFNTMVTYMTPGMTMVRADALQRWGGFHENGCRFGEDTILWAKLLLNCAVYFHLEPLTEFHRELSELSGNYAGPRPIEPFLLDPSLLSAFCPEPFAELLNSFYALRACKAACMLTYWGQCREARQLLRRFVSARHWRTPLFGAALAGSNPVGAFVGNIHRRYRARVTPAGAQSAA